LGAFFFEISRRIDPFAPQGRFAGLVAAVVNPFAVIDSKMQVLALAAGFAAEGFAQNGQFLSGFHRIAGFHFQAVEADMAVQGGVRVVGHIEQNHSTVTANRPREGDLPIGNRINRHFPILLTRIDFQVVRCVVTHVLIGE